MKRWQTMVLMVAALAIWLVPLGTQAFAQAVNCWRDPNQPACVEAQREELQRQEDQRRERIQQQQQRPIPPLRIPNLY